MTAKLIPGPGLVVTLGPFRSNAGHMLRMLGHPDPEQRLYCASFAQRQDALGRWQTYFVGPVLRGHDRSSEGTAERTE